MPFRIVLLAIPVRIIFSVDVVVMRQMILAIRSHRHEMWPRQQQLGYPVVESAIAEQPVMSPIVHQDQHRVLPRPDERYSRRVQKNIPEVLTNYDGQHNRTPLQQNM